jgi:hypothetical protein
MATVETIAILQPRAIVIYKAYPRKAREHTEAEKANLLKGKSGKYNGHLSPATARKVKSILGTWLTSLDQNIKRLDSGTRIKGVYFPTFVTLTLPAEQMHEDTFVKRLMLDRLLKKLKDKYNVVHYFWRAEPQKNGNIHFHIIIDKWLHWKVLRQEWNTILKAHGYIEIYRQNQQQWHKEGFKARSGKWSIEKQKEAYEQGIANNWSDPNSTDIHKINNVKSLSAYVTKYMAKVKSEDRSIAGRLWGCSDALRLLKPFRETLSVSENFIESGNTSVIEYVEQCEKEAGPDAVYEDEFIKVIKLKSTQETYLKRLNWQLYKQYTAFHKQVLIELYPVAIFVKAPEVPEFIPF